MVQALSKKDFKSASDLMPSKIEMAINEPKVFELTKAVGEQTVLGQIEFELIKLASLMSVGGNLNNSQVQFIARQLLNSYPTESIADFKICFERGAFGNYGAIQRMDGITVREWMAKYLEEKYLVVEDMLMKEKDDIYKPAKLTETEIEHVNRIDVTAMLNEYAESVKAFDTRAILTMSEDEIEKEGQERSSRIVYRYDETEAGIRLREAHEKIFAGQELEVRKRHPEWSDQQVIQRCEELKQYLIQEETKPKWSSHLGKIWEAKKKRKL